VVVAGVVVVVVALQLVVAGVAPQPAAPLSHTPPACQPRPSERRGQ